MRWVSAISDLDDTAGALASVGAQVQEQLAGERPDLLLVFSTPDHAAVSYTHLTLPTIYSV